MANLLQNMKVSITNQPTNRFHFNGQFGRILAWSGVGVFTALLFIDIVGSTSAIWGTFFDPFQVDIHGNHPDLYTKIGITASIIGALAITIGYFYTFFTHGSGYYHEKQAQDINEAIHQHDALKTKGWIPGFIYWLLHTFDDVSTLIIFFFLTGTNIRALWLFQNPRHDQISTFLLDSALAIVWDYLATQGLVRTFHVLEDSIRRIRMANRYIISIPEYSLREVEEEPIVIPANEEPSAISSHVRRPRKEEATTGTFRTTTTQTGMEDLPLKRRDYESN